MKTLYLIAALALSLSATAAASTGEEVLKKGNCLMCHANTQKGSVPGWKSIATKYAGDKSISAKLEAKVRQGGSGSFGGMPMPATPKTISDDEIKVVVAWVLNQK